jgi:hypothetical protein
LQTLPIITAVLTAATAAFTAFAAALTAAAASTVIIAAAAPAAGSRFAEHLGKNLCSRSNSICCYSRSPWLLPRSALPNLHPLLPLLPLSFITIAVIIAATAAAHHSFAGHLGGALCSGSYSSCSSWLLPSYALPNLHPLLPLLLPLPFITAAVIVIIIVTAAAFTLTATLTTHGLCPLRLLHHLHLRLQHGPHALITLLPPSCRCLSKCHICPMIQNCPTILPTALLPALLAILFAGLGGSTWALAFSISVHGICFEVGRAPLLVAFAGAGVAEVALDQVVNDLQVVGEI